MYQGEKFILFNSFASQMIHYTRRLQLFTLLISLYSVLHFFSTLFAVSSFVEVGRIELYGKRDVQVLELTDSE